MLRSIFYASVLLMLPAGHVFADNWSRALLPEKITVVMDDSLPPLAFKNADGEPTGLLPELWALWSKRMNIPVDLRLVPWVDAQAMLQRGEADVIDSLHITAETKELYQFGRPHSKMETMLFYRKDLTGIVDAKTARAFTVGVKIGGGCASTLQREGVRTQGYLSYQSLMTAAQRGDVQVFCMYAPSAQYFMASAKLLGQFKASLPLYTTQLSWAVAREKQAMWLVAHAGFSLITQAERDALTDKWLGAPLPDGDLYSKWFFAVLTFFVLLSSGAAYREWVVKKTLDKFNRALEQAQRAEEVARDRLTSTLDAFPDLFLELDAYGRCVTAGTARSVLRDPVADQIVGKHFSTFMKPSSSGVLSDGVRLATPEHPFLRTFKAQDEAGARWFEVLVEKRVGSAGNASLYRVVSRDITERRLAEEASARASRALRMLIDGNKALFDSNDKDALLSEICHVVCRSGDYPGVWVGLARDDLERTVEVVASYGLPAEFVSSLKLSWREDSPFGRGPTGCCIRQRTVQSFSGTEDDTATSFRWAATRELGLKSCLAVPLIWRDSVIGALVIYSKEVHAFDHREEVSLLEELATTVAFGLETLNTRREKL